MSIMEAVSLEMDRLMGADADDVAMEVERAKSVASLAGVAIDQMRAANDRCKLQMDALRLADSAIDEQVSANRQLHDRQVKRQKPGGRQWDIPVGTEVVRKGYVWVKVAMWPTKKGTKDNWKQKSIVEYERLHGDVPEGCDIVFADRDQTNFDPDNLVAVPRNLMAIMNGMGGWNTPEELQNVMALAKLKRSICDVTNGERTCWRCGKSFKPSYRGRIAENVRTCPDCRAAGHKAPPKLTGKAGTVTCCVCGETFEADKRSQRRCRKCIDAMPKGNIKAQRSRYERTGRR